MESINIKENLNKVEEKIVNACIKAERSRDSVELIAVSKFKSAEMIMEAYDAGIRTFGENRVSEMLEKENILPKDIKWHLIGHLQRNKAKQVVGKACMIHSVESEELAFLISKYSLEINQATDILVEVNIANEESKFGVKEDELIEFIKRISKNPGIRIRGLMTVAPYVENPEDNRQYFKRMRELSVDITKQNIDNVSMDYLSMGMTGDYEVAISEGATFVRIGTGIFGER